MQLKTDIYIEAIDAKKRWVKYREENFKYQIRAAEHYGVGKQFVSMLENLSDLDTIPTDDMCRDIGIYKKKGARFGIIPGTEIHWG